jgi:phosphoribosylformylglycinamidine (FGAM) synthase-like enzyme
MEEDEAADPDVVDEISDCGTGGVTPSTPEMRKRTSKTPGRTGSP